MLKVGSPQPQVNQEPLTDMNAMLPMEGPQPNDGSMMNNMPPMDDGTNGMKNQFDNDFDAGVDADEEQDPRRYIEQLAGKLSQKLNDYNQNQQQPDSELCKYVVGMIAAQAAKGLSPEDADEVIKKIESGEEDFEETQQENDAEMPEDNPQNMMGNEQAQDNMPMESVSRYKMIDEVFQDLTNPERNSENIELKKRDKTQSFRKGPYISPNFI